MAIKGHLFPMLASDHDTPKARYLATREAENLFAQDHSVPYAISTDAPSMLAPRIMDAINGDISREIHKKLIDPTGTSKKGSDYVRFTYGFDLDGQHYEWNLDAREDMIANPVNILRARISKQLAPPDVIVFSRNREMLERVKNPAERRALNLLRDIVGEDVFRRFLSSGTITVVGQSGTTYVVRTGRNRHIEVRDPADRNKTTQELCVVFKNPGLPVIDEVIMKILMLKNDEKGLREVANVWPV